MNSISVPQEILCLPDWMGPGCPMGYVQGRPSTVNGPHSPPLSSTTDRYVFPSGEGTTDPRRWPSSQAASERDIIRNSRTKRFNRVTLCTTGDVDTMRTVPSLTSACSACSAREVLPSGGVPPEFSRRERGDRRDRISDFINSDPVRHSVATAASPMASVKRVAALSAADFRGVRSFLFQEL